MIGRIFSCDFQYFTIYPWFLSASLHLRPQLIPWIVKRLTEAKASPTDADDRAEVCIDFLRRNAFSNAEPMESLVLPGGEADEDVEVAYWIRDSAIVVAKLNRLTGKAKIGVSRASGAAAQIVDLASDEAEAMATFAEVEQVASPADGDTVRKLNPFLRSSPYFADAANTCSYKDLCARHDTNLARRPRADARQVDA